MRLSDQMPWRKEMLRAAQVPALVFLLLAIGTGLIGFQIYSNQRGVVRNRVEQTLQTIADLKRQQISVWLQQQLADAWILNQDAVLSERAARYMQHAAGTDAGPDLRATLKGLMHYRGYLDVALVDSWGQVRLTVGPSPPVVGPTTQSNLMWAMQFGRPMISDLHSNATVAAIHLDLIAPLFAAGQTGATGALLMRISPQTALYPMLRRWPASSDSAETLLVRRDGDYVQYLNPLPRIRAGAMELRSPLSRTELACVRAVKGQLGLTMGRDYRGVPTVAVASRISESGWYLIVKEDAAEIYQPINRIFGIFVASYLVWLVFCGAVLLAWWLRRQARIFKKRMLRETAQRLQNQNIEHMVKYANDIILLANGRGRLIWVNERALKVYGYTEVEMLQKSILDLHPAQGKPDDEEFLRSLGSRQGLVLDTVHQRRNGSCFPVEASVRAFEADGQKYFQIIARDRTDHYRLLQDLRAQARRQHGLAELSQTALTATDPAVWLDHFARTVKDILRVDLCAYWTLTPAGDALQMRAGAGWQPEPAGAARTPAGPGAQLGFTLTAQEPVVVTDLKSEPHFQADPILSRHEVVSGVSVPVGRPGQVQGVLGVHVVYPRVFADGEAAFLKNAANILWEYLALNATEEELRRQEARFRQIIESSPMGVHMYRLEADGRLGFAGFNPAADRILKMRHEPFLGRDILELFPGLEGTKIPEQYRALCRGEITLWHGQVPYSNGRLQGTFDIQAFHVAPGLMTSMFLDVTEQKRAEEALQQSEEQFRLVAESTPVPLLVSEQRDGTILYANDAFHGFMGLHGPELIGRNTHEFFWDDQDRLKLRAALERDGILQQYEVKLRGRGNAEVWTLVAARPGEYRGRKVIYSGYQDITAIKQAEQKQRQYEERIYQMQKMESLGTMAGAIAHDFNNLLMVILGNAEMTARVLGGSDPCATYLAEIMTAGKKAAELSHCMLAFTGKSYYHPKPVDIAALLQQGSAALRARLNPNISLVLKPPGGPLWVNGDSSQILQVFMNVCVNAMEAVDPDHGRIEITAMQRECKVQHDCHNEQEQKQPCGRRVCFSVTDNGCGMPPAVRARLFEPFYSTKFIGRGLGLPVAQGIVWAHNGSIAVRSEPGRGACIEICLPALQPLAAPAEAAPAGRVKIRPRVLVVDDDEGALRVCRQALMQSGCTVDAYTSGQQAADFVRAHPGQVNVALVDVTMPLMDGPAVLRELRRLDPAIRVLLLSGFDVSDLEDQLRDTPPDGFIQKPVRGSELVARVVQFFR